MNSGCGPLGQDPPTVEEIVAVMRAAGDGRHGRPLRGLVVVRWRAALRIHEALALNHSHLAHRRGALVVRRGKSGRRREVGMDECAWEHLHPWLDPRLEPLRHAQAVEMTRSPACRAVDDTEQRLCLQGVDVEIIDAVDARRAPMAPVSASLRR
jgi:site-specific recombinase XerC